MFIHIISWIGLICYTICFIPQIIENYRVKTTRGWSDSFMLTYFLGLISILYYIFCLHLPLVYKIMVPIQTFLISIVIMQRIYYDHRKKELGFPLLFTFICIFSLAILPYAFIYPQLIGDTGGWLSFAFFTAFPIPQIIKIFKEKSVEGFSIGFLTIFTIASLCECILACTGILPLQTILTVAKNLITSLIFYLQFFLYKKEHNRNRL